MMSIELVIGTEIWSWDSWKQTSTSTQLALLVVADHDRR